MIYSRTCELVHEVQEVKEVDEVKEVKEVGGLSLFGLSLFTVTPVL